MSDELKPALTADQWRVLDLAESWRLDGGDLRTMREPAIIANVAMANAALPDDSPYKITQADENLLRVAAERLYDANTNAKADALNDLAAKLAAFLRPENQIL